ncbi:MAG TPA: acyl-CoA dehydrogenase family protein [Acidimicrobiales bacterium]|nr:acyl-CoA dehydrogenase family protein [Acidimicrobiales bacterium]
MPASDSDGGTFRRDVRAFLAANLPEGWRGLGSIADRAEADAFVEGWRKILYDNGLLGLTWPVEYGGAGRSRDDQVVLAEELARVGVPTGGYSDMFGIKMVGNTLLRWGTEEQKRQYLPRILSGEDVWCQGFSEPDAGSDLAGLRTAATLVDGRWVVNGQKIWTSRAQFANWIFVLARTEPEAERHRGLSFLLLPVHQPGVVVRPIAMLSGEEEFNEVFFDGATTDAANVVGERGQGWKVAMTLLGHERGEEAATNPVLFRAELDRLVALARERGVADRPLVRDRLASLHIRCEIMRYLGLQTLEALRTGDGVLGPGASTAKLYWSEYHRDVAALALDLLGADALVPTGRGPLRPYRTDDPGAPNTSGAWVGTFYNSVAGTIYAGTSEVQRNILAENVLGLPRAPRVAR